MTSLKAATTALATTTTREAIRIVLVIKEVIRIKIRISTRIQATQVRCSAITVRTNALKHPTMRHPRTIKARPPTETASSVVELGILPVHVLVSRVDHQPRDAMEIPTRMGRDRLLAR
jgi:hypothetical protein